MGWNEGRVILAFTSKIHSSRFFPNKLSQLMNFYPPLSIGYEILTVKRFYAFFAQCNPLYKQMIMYFLPGALDHASRLYKSNLVNSSVFPSLLKLTRRHIFLGGTALLGISFDNMLLLFLSSIEYMAHFGPPITFFVVGFFMISHVALTFWTPLTFNMIYPFLASHTHDMYLRRYFHATFPDQSGFATSNYCTYSATFSSLIFVSSNSPCNSIQNLGPPWSG